MKPRHDGDPLYLDGHRILGRLGEGGQGVVYLGESPEGRQVAIKTLGAGLDDPDARARFRQEIGYARRVKAFCTAQVLASGELGGDPYVVSEYVDGPSLAQVILERGALRGAELRRLAIGTLTALAAIHQAGVVHRDFKPGNVLLSRHGPRVIDFGISRALEESEATGDHIVGTPPYMAPEQFGSDSVGPAADLFAWASTMVAAATGRPPFGTGDLPALINRILTAEPDLGALDGELRELAARCLAKNPAARPTATQALLTLLGHRVPEQRLRDTGEQELLAQGQQSAAPPTIESARGPKWPWAAGGAGVVAAGAALFFLLRPAPAPPPKPSPTPAPVALPTPREGRMALTSTSEVTLAGSKITMYENPADPAWATSYRDERKGASFETYTRDAATGKFAFFGNWEEPLTSPGGRFVATLSVSRFQRTDFEHIRIRDRVTGQDRELRTVNKPETLFTMYWSEDGRRLLSSVIETGTKERTVGFAVVDPVGGTVKVTRAASADKTKFTWGSDGNSVLHQAPDGTIEALDLDGRPLRTFKGLGDLAAGGASRTELGTIFATICPRDKRSICFWDELTGATKGQVRLPEDASFNGWLDDAHLLVTDRASKKIDVVMTDTKGRIVRTLATGPRSDFDHVVIWYSRK